MLSRLLLLLGILCFPHQQTAASVVPEEEQIALVVIAETNQTDAYCSVKEHRLVNDRLNAVFHPDDSDDSDDRRELVNRSQCQKKCSGFPMGYKDSHCWIVYPKCESYIRRAMTDLRPGRLNHRERELDDSDDSSDFIDQEGNWESSTQVSSQALKECMELKTKIESVLPSLQNEKGLSVPCKKLMHNHFKVGCMNVP